ncbi:peptide chain release factor-like protein [bacterium]|nr:peptide chain release factor-like protein [bacterium]
MVDLEITHTKGSGPGGQNRNKRSTAVRIVHLPTGTTIFATERRSQLQNLEAGLQRLEEKLEKLRHRPKTRHDTKPTKASKRVRVESKRKHAATKTTRRRPSDGDW